MYMQHRRQAARVVMMALACTLVMLAFILYIAQNGMHLAAPRASVASSSISRTRPHTNANAPTPFMYRPYYGTRSIAQRTTSFVDHDKPWYVTDSVFVRYDGARWTNASIGSCTGGVNCYDGHDGYDLNLWFEPVLSVASGTVIRAGWYNAYNHESAYGLWAAVDHHNGYATAYGHLSTLMVSVGENVGTQWQLGTSGTTGSSTGPHLHLATFYLPNWSATDPSGWTGNYADPNVVPDNYLWVNNPGTSYTIPDLSANGSAVYPGAKLVDDGGTGWSSTGSWMAASSSTDINGNLHWTATSNGAATASATWQPTLPHNGYYEVGIFVDDNNASSGWATYTINSADPNNPNNAVNHIVYVDEEHIGTFPGPYGQVNTGPQWVSLGTYYFSSAVASSVVLSNATGESGLQLAADGMEFVPANIPGQPPLTTYGFSVVSDNTPGTILPGSAMHVQMTLNNTSNFTWDATGTNAVQLTYQWLNAQNQSVCVEGGSYQQHVISSSTNNTNCPPTTVPLPQNVAPNTSVNVAATVQTPTASGTYTLQWDMVQGSTVFSGTGAQAKNDTVNVTGYAKVYSPLSSVSALPKTYYFAEGYTGTGTAEYLSLTNPATGIAHVTITYLYASAAARTRSYSVAAQSHSVLDINTEAGANQTLGMIVQSNQPFVAERTMYTQKGVFTASSDSTGSSSLSKTWYFAEGNTTYGWNTLLAVLNPSSQAVKVNISYLLQHGDSPGGSKTYTIAPRSRGTIILNKEMPNQQFGMAITASQPVLIERPEFLVAGTLHGGNSVVGATSPSTTCYFGGGNTTPGFSEQLVLANPSTTVATVQIHYLTLDGQVLTQSTTIPARSRIQVNVNDAITQMQHATVIISTTPIVAERQDFFTTNLNGPITGSTITMGSPALHTGWYLAHGDTASGHAEYIALANPTSKTAHISVVYYQLSSPPIVKTYTLGPNSRMTISINGDVGANKSVGVAINATSAIMVEEVMFFNMQGMTGGFVNGGVGVD